jgi:hypothetical protein
MKGRRRSADRIFTRRSGARAAFTLAALLAVFLQAFVVQTHIHTSGLLAPPAYEQTVDTASEHIAHVTIAPDHQQGCIICQALTTNASAALPGAASVAIATNASYETAALQIRRAPRALTHSWQSRAPPIAA